MLLMGIGQGYKTLFTVPELQTGLGKNSLGMLPLQHDLKIMITDIYKEKKNPCNDRIRLNIECRYTL